MRICYYLIIKRSDQIIVSILLSSNKLSVSQKLYYFYQLSLLKRVFGFKEIWDKQNMRVAVFFV